MKLKKQMIKTPLAACVLSVEFSVDGTPFVALINEENVQAYQDLEKSDSFIAFKNRDWNNEEQNKFTESIVEKIGAFEGPIFGISVYLLDSMKKFMAAEDYEKYVKLSHKERKELFKGSNFEQFITQHVKKREIKHAQQFEELGIKEYNVPFFIAY